MKDVAIIGAGLAGLNGALTLQRTGLDVVLLEASDAAGGRVRTDELDGFLLDRGFQVLLTSYPDAESVLDYSSLDLRKLRPGALVWKGDRFHEFADPFREPLAAVRLAFDPIVTMGDKLRVARLRGRVSGCSLAELFSRDETTTRTYLERFGFSAKIIECFFDPFFGGVFLEKGLVTSSRYFEFLFRMFSTGSAALPAAGMRAIPEQIAGRLQPGTLILNSRVSKVTGQFGSFVLSCSGQADIAARRVVIATEEPAARQLLQGLPGAGISGSNARLWNCTTAFYFVSDNAPINGPILMLNGEGEKAGPVNNAVVLSEVSPSYAPAGGHLISASVIGQAPSNPAAIQQLESEVRQQLSKWFGAKVNGWRSLAAKAIQHSVPLQETAEWEKGDPKTGIEGLFLCGDFIETASIQGSLASGRRAAQSLLNSFKN